MKQKAPWEDDEICSFRAKYQAIQVLCSHSPTEVNRGKLRSIAKEFSELYLKKQENFLEETCDSIMRLSDSNHQSKAAWTAINQSSGRKPTKMGIISATSDEELDQLWYNHFNKLLNPDASSGTSPDLSGIHPAFTKCSFNCNLFTLTELRLAAKSLTCGKACGLDGIVNEVLKLEELHPNLLQVMNTILISKKPPSDWMSSALIPVL